MLTISLHQFHKLMERCGCVAIDDQDQALVYPVLAELNGLDDNEFMYLSHYDADSGLDYSWKFTEGDNQEVRFDGCCVFPVDDEGDEIQLTVMWPIDAGVKVVDSGGTINRRS